MNEAIELEKSIVQNFRSHLKRIQLDDFHRLMAVRRILVMENAPEAMKKFDEVLIENLSALITSNVLIGEQLVSINSFMDEFATYPITTNQKLFKELTDKINKLNSGI